LFLELEEELALFGKITLCLLGPATGEELRTFSSTGVTTLRELGLFFIFM